MMPCRLALRSLATVMLAVLSAAACAHTRAVLIGVSSYPTLDEQMQLEGPRYDVEQFRELLLNRGIAADDLQVLADGVAKATDPNRANILAALARVAQSSQPGDFVLLMFSGHGSQQPAKSSREEPDGLDEIFLPRDIGRWDGEVGAVRNAITDNELGDAIARIRNRGAFVWAVFDVCHSGTITRGMPPAGERDRQVTPAALGIDARTMSTAAARGAAAAERTRGGREPAASMVDAAPAGTQGGFVAFYAAQSHETAPEMLLPLYTAGANPRGLFSYTLQQTLNMQPNATYRQTIERALQVYQGMGRTTPTPTYEGDGLDATVLGGTGGAAIAQWRVDNDNGTLKLNAGVMQQVTTGSILAVVPTPLSKDADLVGYVKVAEASATTSRVVPVEYKGRPMLAAKALGASVYARPVELKVDLLVRVGRPARGTGCEAPSAVLTQAVTTLETGKAPAQRVQWVASDAAADVRLCQRKGHVLFLDGAASLKSDGDAQAPGLALNRPASSAGGTGQPLAVELATHLQKITRVVNLSRLVASIGGEARVQTTVTWRPACAAKAPQCSTTPQQLSATSRPAIRAGDQVSIKIDNPALQPVDVTVLYVDAAYGITAMFPSSEEGYSPRIAPRAATSFDFTVNADTVGFERMLVIAVPAQPQAPETSFVSLAQSGVGASRGGGARGALADLLEEAAFGSGAQGTTRGAGRNAGRSADAAQFAMFGWTVLESR